MEDPERKQEVQKFDSKIIIGDRVTATGGLQIASQGEVIIEDDVMFASNVFMNDALHGYQDATEPYKYQPLWKIKPIMIGKGSWIGQNVVILPGVTIGELSIIGANSVVTKSIPKHCIAMGSPARVIKKWDGNTCEWISI
jgi:acetyltransferase-like isoleucine patch superfamily enzyme